MTSQIKNNTSVVAREGEEQDKDHFSVARTHTDTPVHVEEHVKHLSTIFTRSTQPQVQIESIDDLLDAVKPQEKDPCQDKNQLVTYVIINDNSTTVQILPSPQIVEA